MTRRRLSHHFQVTGTTQSGKTEFIKELLEDTPRFVILDLMGDFPDTGSICTSFREASVLLRNRAPGPELQVVLQADDPFHHLGLAEYMWELWKAFELNPVVLVMDEARHWYRDPVGSKNNPPEALTQLYTAGLKKGVACCTIMQFPQQVAPGSRSAADYKIAFRHHGTLTTDMRTAFSGREDELAALETPSAPPEKGVHFLTYPPELQPRKAWRREIVNPMR